VINNPSHSTTSNDTNVWTNCPTYSTASNGTSTWINYPNHGTALNVLSSSVNTYAVIDCNEWRTEKRHECANMGKVKQLEL